MVAHMALLGSCCSRAGSAPACHRGTESPACAAVQREPECRQQQVQLSQRRRRHGGERASRLAPCAGPPAELNPQNVDNPLVLPSPQWSPEQVVAIQLEALQRNSQPWNNHGIQTAYEFGLDVGGMEMSWYFGFTKDLYHQDHFAGAFSVKLPELVNNTGHTILAVREEAEDAAAGRPATTVVSVEVRGPAGVAGAAAAPAVLEFHLRREVTGFRKGALLTYMIKRAPAGAAAPEQPL